MRDGHDVIVATIADMLRAKLCRLSVRRRRAATASAIMQLLEGLDRGERALVVLDVVRETFGFKDEQPDRDRIH